MADTAVKDRTTTLLEIPQQLHARKVALGYKWRWVDVVEIGIGVAEKLLAEENARKQVAQASVTEMLSGSHATNT